MSVDQECAQIETALEREGQVLVGWVVIADYLDGDGKRRLEKYCCGGQPHWVSDGMLGTDWSEEEEVEDDAEEG